MAADAEATAWTEHTHSDGRRYYYNRVTKASSWDKPEALKTEQERTNTTSWKEYKTADGRDYFFNPITKQSVWEMPIELKRLRGLAKDESSDEEKGKEEEEEEEKEEWNTPEERRTAFRALIEDKGVKCTMKWEEALKLIQDDRRFTALGTAGERKQVFAEFVTQTKKREVEERREKKMRAKDDFVEALKAWPDMKPGLRYKEVAEKFYQEEWFGLMEEDDRDEQFQDYMEEFEKRSKEERRKVRKEKVDEMHKEWDKLEDVTPTTRWRDIEKSMKENEVFNWMTKLEALTCWEEWIAGAEKKVISEKQKERFREERKARDACRDALQKHYEDGKLDMTTTWRDFVVEFTTWPTYLAMLGMGGSTPHDLFDDFIEGLEEKYAADRTKIKKIAKNKALVVASSSTYDWFIDQLSDDEAFKAMPEQHKKLSFEALVAKAKEQDQDAEKAAKKNRKRFVELLQKTREVTGDTTYDEADQLLGKNAAWEAVDEVTRKQCFDIFVDQLRIQSGSKRDKEEASEAEETRKDKKGKAPKKRRVAEEPPPEEPPKKAKKEKKRGREEAEEPEEDSRSATPPVKKKKAKR